MAIGLINDESERRKVIAFVTIKLNSTRLPNKNILLLGGKPLCWHVFETLLQCQTVDEIYVYCSEKRVMGYVPDDPRIIFLERDKWLDGDQVRAQDTYSAFVNDVEADVYLAALTTAPFVTPESIDDGVSHVVDGSHDSAFAAQRLQTFAWYEGEPLNYDPKNIPRTQDLDPVFVETSGFFCFTRKLWVEHHRRIGFNPYIREVDAREAVDIDTKEDYEFARLLCEAGKESDE